ncbi:MAG: ATP-binding protein [Ruminococcus sp.]|nr:ATP-binding protein [Ruminococcus sp.]
MKLLELLFGWTGYEPLSFFLSGLNIILNISYCLLLEYIPLKQFLRIKPKTAVLANTGLIVLCAVFYLCFPVLIYQSETGQIVGLALYFLLFMPLALYLLKGCFYQNLFIIAFTQCATQFVLGIGNWLEFHFGDVIFADTDYALSFFTKIILIAICLPSGVYFLRKLFAAWGGESQTQSFWKVLWIIPTAMCTLTAISGTVYTLSEKNSISFLLSRILSMTALLTCISLMTDIMNRERETAAAKIRADIMNNTKLQSEKSQAAALSAWESMNTSRDEAIFTAKKIIAYAKGGRHDEITAILRDRIAGLDTLSIVRVCENEAVNAIAVYYANLARGEGIEVSYKLDIPVQPGRIQSVDLSRIVGNMLENAVEACRRMDYGAKKIRLHSMMTGDMLVFGMNNSFDGDFEIRPDGRYISRKRESGIATGLHSIRSVAEKYDGSVRFEAEDRVFKTSVRLDMAGVKTILQKNQ